MYVRRRRTLNSNRISTVSILDELDSQKSPSKAGKQSGSAEDDSNTVTNETHHSSIFESIQFGGESDLQEVLSIEDEQVLKKRRAKGPALGQIRMTYEESLKLLQQDAPKNLICEECEKNISVNYCSACNQVFCIKCVELCHPRSNLGTLLHEHEADGCIRILQAGDTSRIVKFETFNLPNNEFFEDEMCKMFNLNQPGTLVSDKSVVVTKSTKPIINQIAKFSVNEVLLFRDPVSRQDAYGRVISEWDFRHGLSAPVISRGDESGIYYVIEMIDLVGDKEILSLVELVTPKDQKNFPEMDGVKDDPLRYSRYLTSYIHRKIRQHFVRKKLGPKFHFRPNKIKKQLLPYNPPKNADGSTPANQVVSRPADLSRGQSMNESLAGGSAGVWDDNSSILTDSVIGDAISVSELNNVSFLPGLPMGIEEDGNASNKIATLLQHAIDQEEEEENEKYEDDEEAEEEFLRVDDGGETFDYSKFTTEQQFAVEKMIEDMYAYESKMQTITYPQDKQSHPSSFAKYRKPLHGLSFRAGNSLEDVVAAYQKIRVLPEVQLCRPSDRHQLENLQKLSIIKRLFKALEERLTTGLMGKGFHVWKANMELLRQAQQYNAAVKIQKFCRRWLCRVRAANS